MSSQPQTLQCIEKVDSDAVICNCKSLQKGPCFFTQQNVPRPIYIWLIFFSTVSCCQAYKCYSSEPQEGQVLICVWLSLVLGTIHDGHTTGHTSYHTYYWAPYNVWHTWWSHSWAHWQSHINAQYIQHTLHLTLQSASGCLQSEYLFSVLFAWCSIQLQYFSHDYAHIHSSLCVCSTVGRPIPNPWCTDAHGSCSCAALLQ